MDRVLGVHEFRRSLSSTLRKVRDDGGFEPVLVGSHRRAEAALVPYERLEELQRAEERLEDLLLAREVAKRQAQPVREGTLDDFLAAVDDV